MAAPDGAVLVTHSMAHIAIISPIPVCHQMMFMKSHYHLVLNILLIRTRYLWTGIHGKAGP